jgi:predicted transcriptional regulator
MNRETSRLVRKLARVMRQPPSAVIEQAVYALALLHDLAGVAEEWKAEAIKRGYRKK